METRMQLKQLISELKNRFKIDESNINFLAEHVKSLTDLVSLQAKQIEDLQSSVSDLYLTGEEEKK